MITDITYFKDWKITIFYEVTCEDTDILIEALMDIHCPKNYIKVSLNFLLQKQQKKL